jgi:antitoxin (DNA-binding transcriptional repressor) of toxin-antitoxin stability system
MRSVGLKILKNKLSEYVRLAAGGETILITDRDRVVAEIVPPQPGRRPLLADAQLAEAVREGWLTPPVLAGSDPPPRRPVPRRSVIYLDSSVALAHLLTRHSYPPTGSLDAPWQLRARSYSCC